MSKIAPFNSTGPSATLYFVGSDLTNLINAVLISIPKIEFDGPVIPKSVIYPVPFSKIVSSAVCTCVCVPNTQFILPSKYSAIKVNGIRAYEYARKGISVELPLRKIHIKNIELVAYGFPYFTVRVTCSGGTYIRSLLRDICVSLGIPGTMTSLARTQVGPFDIGSAKMAEELMIHGESLLLPTDTAVSHLSKVTVNSVQLKMMVQGKQLSIDSEFSYTEPDHYYRAYGPHGFIGIMKRTNHTLKVEKNIFIEG